MQDQKRAYMGTPLSSAQQVSGSVATPTSHKRISEERLIMHLNSANFPACLNGSKLQGRMVGIAAIMCMAKVIHRSADVPPRFDRSSGTGSPDAAEPFNFHLFNTRPGAAPVFVRRLAGVATASSNQLALGYAPCAR